ncbi:sigma-54-dependent Fis family transcriptional regulator [Actomonas aquatica]|uniref:Sigma 54-interacting transcriptional regulator n=1 Tax=Actomonas aquatica TaxID=2866162 RepID=A0ABZ1C3Y4_9BACT|nr:sigma 54-interacting transcriptional regulator [Opitutus sp. WL0086]WRQ86211.1 sigma 54-interacting transcriptional regulator [Opitutus sp. WL0086]
MNLETLPSLMLEIASARDPADVPTAVVTGLARCDAVALVRIWLPGPGDRCATCRWRERCRDQTSCLHLSAGHGNSLTPDTDLSGETDGFNRMPLNLPQVGRVASTGRPYRELGLNGKEAWIIDQAWARRERLRTYAAQPLVFRGETLGVLEMFDRHLHGDAHFKWLRIFADHVAVTLSNARAFAEIERLQARTEAENRYLQDEVRQTFSGGEIVGNSTALRRVLEQIALVAPTDASVLVLGESGTGKEMVARVLHDRSPRRARALIKVNCSAIPEALFESEMFGHVKGAFSGAIRDRVGRFQLADGGTLFLDEIGDMPLAAQAKLLRVLQEREIERVGDDRTQTVDVRIVAATHRDLEAEVAAGRFRADLYYRLRVFPLTLPPLRKRRSDIPLLAAYFAASATRRLKLPGAQLPTAEVARLQNYAWPGNVRELQNLVERAAILARGGPMRFGELLGTDTGAAPVTATPHDQDEAVMPLTVAELRALERRNLALAMKRAHGRVRGPGGAAELLGVKPTTLASRLNALGLARRDALTPVATAP